MSNSNFLDVSSHSCRPLTDAACQGSARADAPQKAIALVQKAIDEDVKQNYAVGRVLPDPWLAPHPIWVLTQRSGGIQAVPGCSRLLYDGDEV
jgi:hypothetical protein